MVQFGEVKDNAGVRSRNVSSAVTSRPTHAAEIAVFDRNDDIERLLVAANQDGNSEEVDQVGESLK